MEMPEDFKFAILDEARKKYNNDIKQLVEKEKENERLLNSKVKERICLQRELFAISEKGWKVLKEKREGLSEEDWKQLCAEIQKIKDENIKANILKRMSAELVNDLPSDLKKLAFKYRKDLLDFPSKKSLFQEESKEEIGLDLDFHENARLITEEVECIINFEDKNENFTKDKIASFLKVEEILNRKTQVEKSISQVHEGLLMKFLHAFVLISKKNPKKEDDFLYKTRYFLKSLRYLFYNPFNSYKLLDGLLFLLIDYPLFIQLPNISFNFPCININIIPENLNNKPIENENNVAIDNNSDIIINNFLFNDIIDPSPIKNNDPNPNKTNKEELNELHNAIIDFLSQLITNNCCLPLIFQFHFESLKPLQYTSLPEPPSPLSALSLLRSEASKISIKQKEISNNFLTLLFELLKNPSLEGSLIDFVISTDSKLVLCDETKILAKIPNEEYPLTPLYLASKQEMLKMFIFHPRFLDKNYLKSFYKIFLSDLGDFELVLTLLLSLFYEKFNKALEETNDNIEAFKIGYNLNTPIKQLQNEGSKLSILTSFFEEIVKKFTDLKNLSRSLKYLFTRFRRIFKKECFRRHRKDYEEKVSRNEEVEIIRSWFQEKEKNDLMAYISRIKPLLENDQNTRFFKNIITNIDFLIEFIGEDFSQENGSVSLCYKVFKCGFKAFIYVYSFLNPLEEVEYESLEKDDTLNEVPQLSKLLTLEVEDQKEKKIMHLEEVFEMLNEKFCPILDFYVKSCSNRHGNNNLSHAWRYLIQKNINFSTLSADTKFILIK